MYSMQIGQNEYKVKFGFNSFCDTDLMDRTKDLLELFQQENVANDDDASSIGKIKDLFSCVRELLFVGFRKYNPVESLRDVGDLLDQYHDEGDDENPHGIMNLFTDLATELMTEGFLGDLMKAETSQTTASRPTLKKNGAKK